MNWQWLKLEYLRLISFAVFIFGMFLFAPALLDKPSFGLDLGLSNIGAFFSGIILAFTGIGFCSKYESEIKKLKEGEKSC